MKNKALNNKNLDKIAEKKINSFIDIIQHNSDFLNLQSSILNALPANICLIDSDGFIVTVNQTWKEFGKQNYYKKHDFGVGLNYFDICNKAFKDRIVDAEAVSNGIRSVMSNETKFFNFEYQLFEGLWYKVFVTPLVYETNVTGAIITHVDISTQKKMELEIRKSEEYFKSLTLNTPNMIIEVNKDLEITYINKIYHNLKIEDVLGKSVLKFVSPKFQELVRNKINNVFITHEKEKYEITFISEDNESFWYVTNAGPVLINGEVNSVILSTEDITVQKEMENKLKLNTNFLLEAQRIAKVGILELDLGLNIINFSEQVFDLFEIKATEKISLDIIIEKIHPEDIRFFKLFIKERELNQKTFEFRLISTYLEVEYISCTIKTNIDSSIILTVQNITEQKKHEIILEHIYKGLSSNIGLKYLQKMTDFICSEFGVSYCYIVGYYPETDIISVISFSGKDLDKTSKITSDISIFDISLKIAEIILSNGESFFSNNIQEIFPNNEIMKERNIQGYIGIPISSNSKSLGLLVIMDDKKLEDVIYKKKLLNIFSFRLASEIERLISEEEIMKRQNKLEEILSQLENAHKQIIHRERLKALGEMASGIAHDFNNAITPILGYSELLIKNKNISPEKMNKYLDRIRASALNSASVVRGLRGFYRKNIENEFYKNVLINEIIEEVVELTKHKWKNQAQSNNCYIKMEINLGDIPLIFANPFEIKEVLTNLIFNSVDSISNRGKITITTKYEEDKVILEVIDNGHGMSEKVKAKALEPFFTTKGNDGTGLGLSMVYGIVERHKGSINIESIIDQGTTFSIYFPMVVKKDLAKLPTDKKVLKRSLHILIVDDEPDIQDVIADYLSLSNHTFELANNGLHGLEKFQKGYFDLVVTDYAMPEMNGRQMAESIKRIAKDKPIVLLTGFGDIIVSTNEKVEYIDHVISKPFSIDDLYHAINCLFLV